MIPGGGPAGTKMRHSIDRVRPPDDWSIADAQWDAMEQVLKESKEKHEVSIRLNDLRGRTFKEDLVELLSSIPGWDIDDQGTYTAGTLEPFAGVLIQNRSAIDPSPGAALIMKAFDTAAVEPLPRYDATQPQKLRIVVGAPPIK